MQEGSLPFSLFYVNASKNHCVKNEVFGNAEKHEEPSGESSSGCQMPHATKPADRQPGLLPGHTWYLACSPQKQTSALKPKGEKKIINLGGPGSWGGSQPRRGAGWAPERRGTGSRHQGSVLVTNTCCLPVMTHGPWATRENRHTQQQRASGHAQLLSRLNPTSGVCVSMWPGPRAPRESFPREGHFPAVTSGGSQSKGRLTAPGATAGPSRVLAK